MAFTDVCGICNTVPANWGSIYYTGVQRCGLCLDWEYDNADPLYLEFLDKGGAYKGHGKGTVTTTIARTLEGYMATPEPPKRIPRARLKTITNLCLRTQSLLFPKGVPMRKVKGKGKGKGKGAQSRCLTGSLLAQPKQRSKITELSVPRADFITYAREFNSNCPSLAGKDD
jgi:hypothetical protein